MSQENPLPGGLYTKVKIYIKNALSMHGMGFGTCSLDYIMRGLYDILLENNCNYIFFTQAGAISCRIQSCNISLTCLRY